jgi:hypothetical protein
METVNQKIYNVFDSFRKDLLKNQTQNKIKITPQNFEKLSLFEKNLIKSIGKMKKILDKNDEELDFYEFNMVLSEIMDMRTNSEKQYILVNNNKIFIF